MPALQARNFFRRLASAEFALYALVTFASFVLALLGSGVLSVGLGVPLSMGGDGVSHAILVKSVLDNGWYVNNPALGSPFGLSWHDYPMVDGAHFALLALLGLLTDNYAVAFNLFYLLSFPSAALTALYALRRIGLGRVLAGVGALLFAGLALHYMRLSHLFLASYFSVPLFALAAVRIARGEHLFVGATANDSRRRICWALVLLVCASSGVYYAYFGAFFIGVAALAAALRRRSWLPVQDAGLAVGLIAAALVAHLLPSWLHHWSRPENVEAALRVSADAETYGLRLTQLLLPATTHRLDSLAALSAAYRGAAPLTNENMMASLGILAALGLLVSVFVYLFLRERRALRPIATLGGLNLAGFLFGTIGGVGALAAYAFAPQLRSLNRISVYLAFFSIAALLYLVQLWLLRPNAGTPRRTKFIWIALLLLAVGLFDQTPKTDPALTSYNFAQHYADREFGKELMRALPTATRVYQLPYIPFPESAPLYGEDYYGLAKPYLYTNGLAWSYAAMRGSEADQWLRHAETVPLTSRVGVLAASGFGAICVARHAYPDNGKAVEAEIQTIAGKPILVSKDGHWAVYRLDTKVAETAKPLFRAILRKGWSTWEVDPVGRYFVWSMDHGTSELALMNPLPRPMEVLLRFSLGTLSLRTVDIFHRGAPIAHQKVPPGFLTPMYLKLTLPPGISSLQLRPQEPAERAGPNDPRMIGFYVHDIGFEPQLRVEP